MVVVQQESPFSSDATSLLDAAAVELRKRYPGFAATEYSPEEALQPGAAFVVARLHGIAVGCGALRPFASDAVELKRMFVGEEYRRQGISRKILDTLESIAAEMGYARIVLETGTAQPEAIALYGNTGYEQVENFGNHEVCVCFEKSIKFFSPQP